MSEKLNEVVSILLKKHKPKNLFDTTVDNFLWLNDPDFEDVKLLRSIKDDIRRKMESANFRYSGSWFYYVCRRVTVDEKLKKLILD